MAVGITGDPARAGSAPDGTPGPLRGVHRADTAGRQTAGPAWPLATPPLRVEVDASQGAVTVVASGELDYTVAPALAVQLAQIADRKPRRLVFDLAGLCFLDCAAARLIAGSGRSLPAGRRPVIRHARPEIRRILQVSGLDVHCEIEEQPGPGS